MRKIFLLLTTVFFLFSLSCDDYDYDEEYYDQSSDPEVYIEYLHIKTEYVSTVDGKDQCQTLWTATLKNNESAEMRGKINATIQYQGQYVVLTSGLVTLQGNQTITLTEDSSNATSSVIACEALTAETSMFNVRFKPE